MFKHHITNSEINELPLFQFDGGVFVIDTFEKLDDYLPLIRDQKILGFDTETKPSFKKGKINQVSLLQLSSLHEAFLIRINKIGLPQEIIEILSNKEVKKVGLAIHDDLKGLQEFQEFSPQSFIDLQDFVKVFNIESQSLRKITGIVLNKRISKSQQVSNWEKEELTEGQLLYAATDAWICLQIYKTLNQFI
ncbi:MAG: 3'-5' exonuclease [Bacteroidales bacterium]|jgi:ribonuclease D|nr:3'-5' exonuclease [Bacteroidales bacterium]